MEDFVITGDTYYVHTAKGLQAWANACETGARNCRPQTTRNMTRRSLYNGRNLQKSVCKPLSLYGGERMLDLFSEELNAKKATHYESFYKAAQEMNDEEQLWFYKALDACRFRGIILEGLPKVVRVAMHLAIQTIKEEERTI